MNFLAHLYLSGEGSDRVLVGNFFGDFIKGKAFEEYHPKIQKGVLLHREIDRYTDQHPVVLQSKERLRPVYHHYAPVIVDVFYDHFLASMWDNYHEQDLETFTSKFYETMTPFLDELPKQAVRMFSYMRRDNWLFHYKYTDGINQALSGMAHRTPYDSKMDLATADLIDDYDHYQKEFSTFFPELVSHAKTFLDSLS